MGAKGTGAILLFLCTACGPAAEPGHPEQRITAKVSPSSTQAVLEVSQAGGDAHATVPVGPVLVLMTPEELVSWYRGDDQVQVVDGVVMLGESAVGLDLMGAGDEAASLVRGHPGAASALRADWSTLCSVTVLLALNEAVGKSLSLTIADTPPAGLPAGDCLREIEVEELHLKLEQADDTALVHLAGLRGLRGLDLGGTALTDAGLAHLTGLADLEVLDLYDTDVTDAGLVHVGSLVRLEKLVLWSTHVTDAGLVHLETLIHLRVLNLGALDISGSGLTHLAGMQELRVLDLWLTNVSDEDLEHLATLKNLRVLNLGWADITNVGLAHLRGLEQLRSLDLGLADITDEGLFYLSGLSELRVLDLSMTDVSDTGLAHLCALTKLRELTLVETGVTEIGTSALQKILPELRVNLYQE
jgi:hypothetical protein